MLSLKNLISLFSNSPLPTLILIADTPFFTMAGANDAFFGLTHTKKRDLIGKAIFEGFPENPGDTESTGKKEIFDSLEQVRSSKKPHQIQLLRYDIRAANGDGYQVRYWNCDSYPILDNKGDVRFIVQHPTDVSDMISAENLHLEFNNKLLYDRHFNHPLFNDYPDAVFTLDVHGNFLNANQALADLAECTREELLKMSFIPFIPAEAIEQVLSYFHSAVKGEIQHFETPALTTKGNRRTLQISNLPLIVNKEVIGVYAVAKDVSQQRQHQLELEIKQKQLDVYNEKIVNILESITDGFLVIDHDWTVTYWNKEAEKMTGVSSHTILDRQLWEIFDASDQQRSYGEFQKAMTQDIAVRFEDFLPRMNTWFEVSAFPSKDGLSIFFKDITSRKNSEAQVAAAKEQYQHLFNSTPVPSWVYDAKTFQFLDVNAAAIKHYGYTREEFLSTTLWNIIPHEDFETKSQIIANAKETDLFKTKTLRHIKKSGEVIFVKTERNAITFNNTAARIVVAVDITEKLKIEQALKASEQRFKSLVQDGSDLIAILDAEGNYKYVSPTSKSVLGLDAEYFIGKNAFDFIQEEDLTNVYHEFARLKTERCIKVPPFRFMIGNGHARWIETILTDMTDEPAVGGIVANSRDITPIIEHELKLKESLERFAIVLKATSDTIWDWNMLTNKVIRSKGKKSTLSKEENLSIHDWWNNLIHPDDKQRVFKKIQRHIRNKKSRWQDQYRFRESKGDYKVVLDRGFIIFNEEGLPIRMIGAMQDVTDREKYTRAIKDQNSKLREIAWMQSHIVRAPLCRIKSLADLIENDDNDEQTAKKLLHHLNESVDQLDKIITEIVRKAENVDDAQINL